VSVTSILSCAKLAKNWKPYALPKESCCHPTPWPPYDERLKFIKGQIKTIEQARLQHLEEKPDDLVNKMVRTLVQIYGLGLETAVQLVHELLSRTLRDRKAVARYAGLTGSPDESGSKRREKGLSRSGNARVRKIMIQLAWRMLIFQPNSALVKWFKQRTENAKGNRKTMIVALARKLTIALWRYVVVRSPMLLMTTVVLSKCAVISSVPPRASM
jgi:Transposase IS116/IS110/IS902 family